MDTPESQNWRDKIRQPALKQPIERSVYVRTKNLHRAHGFSLLEVLIAVAILSVGLLGLAQMQTIGLRNSQSAYYRTQATLLAYDIADRIRTNAVSSAAYVGSGVDLNDIQSNTGTQNQQCNSVTSNCSPATLAANDISNWLTSVADSLPLGSARITYSAPQFTVSITWDDNRDGTVDTSDQTVTTSFQP